MFGADAGVAGVDGDRNWLESYWKELTLITE